MEKEVVHQALHKARGSLRSLPLREAHHVACLGKPDILRHHNYLPQHIHHALCDQLAPHVQGQEPRRQHNRDGLWRATGDRPLIFFERASADEAETQRAVARFCFTFNFGPHSRLRAQAGNGGHAKYGLCPPPPPQRTHTPIPNRFKLSGFS